MQDSIERSIAITAPVERVWGLVTDPGWWVPSDVELEADRTPGQVVVRESEKWGRFPVEVVELRPMSYAAFRWASAFPGEELAPGRSTLIEFTVTPTADGALVSVIESGFSKLDAAEETKAKGFESNSEGWTLELASLRTRAEA
ncbi:MAG: hypothetical protein JWO63_2061 [Frankiales bacterium]|nr:hypothetical protein [Frankiales bacterium]